MPSRRARQGPLGAPLLFDYSLLGTGEDLNSAAFSGTHIQSLHGSAQTGIYAEGDWAGFRCPSLLKRIELHTESCFRHGWGPDPRGTNGPPSLGGLML